VRVVVLAVIVAALVHHVVVGVLPLVVLVLTQTVVAIMITGVAPVRPRLVAGLGLVPEGTRSGDGCRR
jgi:hypothetical protein